MSGNTTTVAARLPEDLKQRLISVCEQSHMNMNDGVMEAIVHYVQRKEERLALRQEAKAAHDKFVLTGKSYSHEAVGNWMNDVLFQGKQGLPE